MRNRTSILILLLLVGTAALAQGPWPITRKGGQVGVGFSYLGYGSILGPDGSPMQLRRKVNQFGITINGQYGLTDRLTFMASVPMVYASTGSAIQAAPYFPDTVAQGTTFGLANITLGINYALVKRKFGLSFFLNGEANVASNDSLTTLRTGPAAFVAHFGMRLGYRNEHLETSLETGYRYRFNGYTKDLDMRFRIGYTWNSKSYITAFVGGRYNMSAVDITLNGLTTDTTGYSYERHLTTALYPNGSQYAEFGVHFLQKFKKFGVWAQLLARYGKRVATGPEVGLGVQYQW